MHTRFPAQVFENCVLYCYTGFYSSTQESFKTLESAAPLCCIPARTWIGIHQLCVFLNLWNSSTVLQSLSTSQWRRNWLYLKPNFAEHLFNAFQQTHARWNSKQWFWGALYQTKHIPTRHWSFVSWPPVLFSRSIWDTGKVDLTLSCDQFPDFNATVN